MYILHIFAYIHTLGIYFYPTCAPAGWLLGKAEELSSTCVYTYFNIYIYMYQTYAI